MIHLRNSALIFFVLFYCGLISFGQNVKVEQIAPTNNKWDSKGSKEITLEIIDAFLQNTLKDTSVHLTEKEYAWTFSFTSKTESELKTLQKLLEKEKGMKFVSLTKYEGYYFLQMHDFKTGLTALKAYERIQELNKIKMVDSFGIRTKKKIKPCYPKDKVL